MLFAGLNYFPCMPLNKYLTRIVDRAGFKNPDSLLFIYKKDICSTCSSGAFIYSINDNKQMAIVFSEEFNEVDVFNIIKIFSLENAYVIGNKLSMKFTNTIRLCSKINNKENIYYVTLKENRKIRSIKYIN